ncbi:MAG TPA: 50S ribosomal protein L16 [archaeon]|nr:50S ribosomal protein L16 [archaeon]
MGIRPAKCYRTPKRPWTRQSRRKPKKGYVKGVPANKIHKFEMGNPNKQFPLKGYLVSNNNVLIRHNALEAARVAANKAMDKYGAKAEYFMKVLVFPHHVLRENATATGAGADRFQTGMRLAFGRPIGTAAHVHPGQRVMEIRAEKAQEGAVKIALKRASAKFPTTCVIELEKAS